MLDTSIKINCNGCHMCADICPAQAITYEADSLTGFDFPKIDAEKCVRCGKCDRLCPQLVPVRQENRNAPLVYAAWSQNDEIRLLCTSGGIFYELAHYIISQNGAVVACRYTDDYKGAYHCIAETEEEIIPQCGSKHVQSQTSKIYIKVKELLESGRQVLFVGTPCQVAALYRYLGTDPDNLVTADFICNSINSPKAQSKYIEYLEEIFGGKVTFSRAKDKRYGWNNFGSSARFDNGKEYYADRNTDMRVVGYHRGHLFIRESCSDCKYKMMPRNADLTLGDFWGIESDTRNPKLEMGTSVVMVNSEKGRRLIDDIPTIQKYEKTFEDVLKGNGSIYTSAPLNGEREKAFKALDNNRFDVVVNHYRNDRDKSTFLQKTKRRVKTFSKKFWRKICGIVKH